MVNSGLVPIVTLDGLAGTGKTSVALALAHQLGWHVLASGMYYRFVAYASLRGLLTSEGDSDQLCTVFARADFACGACNHTLRVNAYGYDITQDLQSEAVAKRASDLAQHKNVRRELNAMMQRDVQAPGVVAEGRDMARCFQHAALHVVLTAKADVRARRRRCQLDELGMVGREHDGVKKALQLRDAQDGSRVTRGDKHKSGRVLRVDTSDVSVYEVAIRLMRALPDSCKSNNG